MNPLTGDEIHDFGQAFDHELPPMSYEDFRLVKRSQARRKRAAGRWWIQQATKKWSN